MTDPGQVPPPDPALQALQARFRGTIQNTIAALRHSAAQLAAAPRSPELIEALRRELHRVHGTAGSYGYTGASAIAARAEERAVRWARDPLLETGERAAIVEHLASALEQAFAEPAGREGAPATNATGGGTGGDARILVAAGLPADMLDTLRAEAALHGFTVRALTLEQCTPAVLRSIGPSLIAVEAPTYSAVVDTVWSIGTPLVVLERRPRAQRTSFVPPLRAGMAVADITDGFGSVFDVAERVLVQGSWAGATILAVDDDPAMLMMVRYVLEAPGIQVISESDPAAVRALIAQAPPTLLLLDVNMPGLDGIEFARSLRQDPGLRDMAILMLSGESDAVHRARALDAGADDFVPKPIVPVELRMRVHSQLERRRLARLAEGIHPGTGLSLAARTQRDAEEAWGAALRAGRACSVFVIRADAEPVPDNDAAAAPWLRETVRVARALGHDARSVGHHDGNALLGVLQLSGSQASDALNLLARSGHAGGVAWHAGVVDAEDLMTPDFPAARRAAEDAADLARTRAQAAVHRWQRGEALAAPDVIVVEDDPALSEMLQYALRATGFTSRAFDNGRVALQELLALRTGATRPFVLLDVDLPGMDGYTLHERLREERPGAFDVVFITVHASESDQLRALRAGAMDYIMKPLNLRILMAKMSSWRAARDRGA